MLNKLTELACKTNFCLALKPEVTISIYKDINNEGKTIAIITHDVNVAKRCKRIIKIEDVRII